MQDSNIALDSRWSRDVSAPKRHAVASEAATGTDVIGSVALPSWRVDATVTVYDTTGRG